MALWYKAWLETRFRFLVSATLITGCSAFFVLGNPFILGTWREWQQLHPQEIEQPWILRAADDYPYFIWHFVFRLLLQQLWVLCVVLISLGGLARESAQGSAGFTLSLPVSRRRLVSARAAVGLLEIAVLGLIPALVIPALSVLIGKPYPVTQGIAHALLMILGGAVFFGLGIFLSTVIQSEHTPALIGVAFVALLYFILTPYLDEGTAAPLWVQMIDVSRVMAGAPYLTTLATYPLWGVSMSLLVAALLFYLSLKITDERDY
jgi:ABC-type transport system involved in multi-copper enzyme maturation permease subunit